MNKLSDSKAAQLTDRITLQGEIIGLKSDLLKQKKISEALLRRVKTSLNQQSNVNEIFEHNAMLVREIKEAKKKLYAQAEASQKFFYLARHDALTGLVNRNEFESRLKQVIMSAKETAQNHALCFLDLDQFKVINDTSGHMAGDDMLKQLAVIIQQHIDDRDTLGRLGGDEFGLIFENCSVSQVKVKVQNILQLIDDFRFAWEHHVFRISVSAGIALIDQKTISHTENLRQADMACFAAKNAGRNRLHVFQEEDDNLSQQSDEMLWVPKINEALEKNRFQLFVQAIKPTSNKENYLHYEILIRLREEDGNIVPPGAFLPTAERYNLITRIDYWVIDQTFSWLARNSSKVDPNSHFSINLSGQSMGDEKVLNYITQMLESGLVSPHLIHFEVTETMAIANLQTANHFIKTVKKYGCGFSLDDFGSGLSSFGYLKNLAVDTLKIDGIFVRDILDDPIDAAMVNSINTIGHVMGLKTIAEFVENEAIAEKLTKIGVDYLQGYGVAKPMPIDELLE